LWYVFKKEVRSVEGLREKEIRSEKAESESGIRFSAMEKVKGR